MAFKEDWSFLDKITMGAVGTESVITQLNAYGHQVIELERYCTSNKIWATKIKRLRIPDLPKPSARRNASASGPNPPFRPGPAFYGEIAFFSTKTLQTACASCMIHFASKRCGNPAEPDGAARLEVQCE